MLMCLFGRKKEYDPTVNRHLMLQANLSNQVKRTPVVFGRFFYVNGMYISQRLANFTNEPGA
jgi:hypothetical protein